jgi:crotonobetainyl-CoA:carnitine CoA-transferase CaiB-like acyl-CoA transferase
MNAALKPPLAGIRIVDFSELLPGPFLTQNLCELGAEVLKVERPPRGDNARSLGGGVFGAVNRGKRSLLADLKDPDQRERVRTLVRDADVLVEGYRPGVMARLGLDYASLAAANPRLVYASLTGYGQSGPLAQAPGHDLNYLSMAGATALSGTPDGGPAFTGGLPVADLCGAMAALSAILAALLQRQATGRGQHLDIAITDCVAHWLNPRLGHFRHLKRDTLASQRRDVLVRPGYGVFTTRDGQAVSIAAMEDHFWTALARLLGLYADEGDALARYAQRAARAEEINARLAAAVAAQDFDALAAALTAADVPWSPVLAPDEVADHPHFVQRGLFEDTEAGSFARFPVPLEGTGPVPREVTPLGE